MISTQYIVYISNKIEGLISLFYKFQKDICMIMVIMAVIATSGCDCHLKQLSLWPKLLLASQWGAPGGSKQPWPHCHQPISLADIVTTAATKRHHVPNWHHMITLLTSYPDQKLEKGATCRCYTQLWLVLLWLWIPGDAGNMPLIDPNQEERVFDKHRL